MTAGSEAQPSARGGEPQVRCAEVSEARQEPMTGTAPRADVWVVVEHQPGWGDAELARSGHDVRVLMARASRSVAGPPDADERRRGDLPRTRVWVHPPSPRWSSSKTSRSVLPLTSFIVKKTRPSASRPSSWTGTMPGWSSWPVIWASCRKRASVRGSTDGASPSLATP